MLLALQSTSAIGKGIFLTLGVPQPTVPGVVGIKSLDFTAQAVVDEKCVATNIFSCGQSAVGLSLVLH